MTVQVGDWFEKPEAKYSYLVIEINKNKLVWGDIHLVRYTKDKKFRVKDYGWVTEDFMYGYHFHLVPKEPPELKEIDWI